MNIQIFGVKNDADTRKAMRFFKERRANIHFNDFKIREPSKGELRKFVQKFGIDAVIDRDSKRFKSLGLHTAHYGEDRWLDIAAEEPEILKMPLVRFESKVTIGHDETTWREWAGK